MNHILQDELWTEAVEGWADKKVKDYLHQNHEEYQKLWEESGSLCEEYPVIDSLVFGKEALKLTEAEHRIFVEYLNVKDMLGQLEKEYHYYLGLATTLPFEQIPRLVRDGIPSSVSEADERKSRILDLLTEGRLEGSDREFQSADERNRKSEEKLLELEEQMKSLGLPEETRNMIDNYVSAVNAQWLKYSEFMYRYGVKDMLALLW